MGVWARLAWGPRGFWSPGPSRSQGPQPRPPRTPLPCLWGRGASTASRGGAGGGESSSPGKDEVGYEGFEGVNEVGDYDDYEVDYEYVDLQKDSDGDGLRDHINDPDDDNDGIPDLEDDDDDGDGVTDREDLDWFAHDEM